MNFFVRTAGIAFAIHLLATTPSAAQSVAGVPVAAESPDPPIAAVPFGPGERLGYKVKLGVFGTVGEGSMEVVGVDTIHGYPTYHLRFDLEGKVLFAEVDDRLESWLDVSRLVARRFEQDQKEVRFKRHRIFDFFPEERRYVRLDREDEGELATDEPLDDVSFLYFVRTLPLEVGKTYTFERYYKADGNPVTLQVLRKERVTVPAGTFQTIVVRPIIKTDGLFGEGGEAEVYFTDDDQRLLVMMKSKVPVIGNLSLHLSSYTPGEPLQGATARKSGS